MKIYQITIAGKIINVRSSEANAKRLRYKIVRCLQPHHYALERREGMGTQEAYMMETWTPTPQWQLTDTPQWQLTDTPQWQLTDTPQWQLTDTPQWQLTDTQRHILDSFLRALPSEVSSRDLPSLFDAMDKFCERFKDSQLKAGLPKETAGVQS